MQEYTTLQTAIAACMESRRFSVARLHKEEKAMDMHIHDCYEVYLTTMGGQEFLIDNHLYDMAPRDVFCISPYESHTILYNDSEPLERIVLFIHPDFVRSLSTPETRLEACLLDRPEGFSHKHPLIEPEYRMFLYHVDQLLSINGFGTDVKYRSRMAEFLIFLNLLMRADVPNVKYSPVNSAPYTPQVRDALAYINEHIQEPLSLADLAEHLYLSESYLCRIFKASTGTTISKYIVGRRISITKSLLALGYSVAESQTMCGFGDYSNFLKAFTKAVGVSPKKYAQLSAAQGAESQ